MTLRPPRPTLFPYTTLFRSHGLVVVDQVGQLHHAAVLAAHVDLHEVARRRAAAVVDLDDDVVLVAAALEAGDVARSEERRVGKECRTRWWAWQREQIEHTQR